MSIVKPSAIYSLSSILSRISGFVRDLFLASFLGANVLADMFFIALRLPMLFKSILTEETFNSAYIPIYSRLSASDELDRKYQFAKRILFYLIYFFVPLIVIVEVFMPNIVAILAPGINEETDVNALITIARITFPYLIVIVISSVFMGSLNSDHKFALTAGLPIILNATLICGIIFYPYLGSIKIVMLSWAVIFGGVLQLGFLFYAADSRFWRSFSFHKKNMHELAHFSKLVWPSIVSSSSIQLNLTVNMMLASFFSGAITYLHFAQRLYWLPIAVVGIAIGSVLIPKLSESIRKGDFEEAYTIQTNVFYYCSIIILPAAFGLGLTSDLIISCLFQRGEFDVTAVKNTSIVLQILSLGLPAAVFIKILVPYFFAVEKPKIPMKITGITVVSNLALTLFLYKFLGYFAIPTALTIAAWINFVLLLKAHKKFGFSPFNEDGDRKLMIICIFSLFLGIEIYTCKTLLSGYAPIVNLSLCMLSAIFFWVIFIYYSDKKIVNYCVRLVKD